MNCECKICHRPFNSIRSLSVHISVTHKISTKSYYDKFHKKKNDGICTVCSKETTFWNLGKGYGKYCSTICSNKSEYVKTKKRETCKSNFGCEYPFQSKEVKDKIKETIQNKYGVDNPTKSESIKRKTKQTCLIKYGVEYTGQIISTKKQKRIKRLKEISAQKFNGEPAVPTIGNNERQCLNELENEIAEHIIRNDPEIGYKIGLFPDGYISSLNLVIEYDEKHHFLDEFQTYTGRDIERELTLASELSCIIFRVKENDWLQNKEIVISSFKMLIELLQEI
jgi:very-short-patch-repair endonuclease